METFPYILTLAGIREKFPRSSWVRVATITMCAKFPHDIDVPKLRAAFQERKTITVGTFNWTMKENGFYNQISICYRDHSNKSVKLFPNGAIQVAGCSDLFNTQAIIKQISIILRTYTGAEVDVPTESIKIAMINTYFSLNSVINLHNVIHHFKSVPNLKINFTTERYSAVKFKFSPGPGMKVVTASIFKTGKVLVSGAKTLQEIAFAYKKINEMMEVPKMRVEPIECKDMYDMILGRPFTEWVTILERRGYKGWN
jgi:TATA-box binding protein (TBP) (component of TFIID and TFIIIB)